MGISSSRITDKHPINSEIQTHSIEDAKSLMQAIENRFGGPMKNVINNAYSTARRLFNKITTANNGNFNKRVNTVNDKNVNAARPSAVVNTARPKAVLRNPQQDLKDKRVINSRCSRHMTGNISYLTDYEEIDMPLEEILKEGKLLGKKGKQHKASCIKNLRDLKLKVIRCDNGTEFKNRVMNQFYEMKGIKREFSVARTPQQNEVAERKNRTLIEAARTMLSMNYKPVVAGNQSNSNAGTKACNDAGKARMETVPGKDYILLPMWPADLLFSQDSKSSPDIGFKPSREEEKMDTKDPGNENEASEKDSEVPSIEEQRVNQELDASINNTNNINNASDGNNTNNVNAVSSTVNAAGIEVNVVDPKTSIELLNDLNMPELKDIVYSNDDEDVGAEADMNNLDAFMPISPILTTRIHKDHPVEQFIGDVHSASQTRRMTKNLEEHGLFSSVQQSINHKDFENCLFACFLSQEEPKKVWTLVDLPNGKRAIGTKWVYRNKKDERGIVIKNKARLVTQGYTQEEGIDYDEVFSLVARIEVIRLFLAYASFKDFVVYQMDVKSDFLYGKIEEEVYVCQPLGFEDPNFLDRMSSIRELTFFLGLQVKQKEDRIFISQDKYVNEILNKFGFSDVKTASTPMEI
ncbi:putative ribonuclease H-like domain-containing protein, partial [Tanacetum coccineum]